MHRKLSAQKAKTSDDSLGKYYDFQLLGNLTICGLDEL